jgi:ADP-heptose:LPS heptosyltransferase
LERTLDTFGRTGFAGLEPVFRLALKKDLGRRSFDILRSHGWDGREKLVLLNPGGLWVTRNWPLSRYEELAEIWLSSEPVKFLFLGTGRIREKVQPLARRLADRAIDLTCRTSLAEALGVLQHASVVISEDSGLLHMAWVSGIPTVAMLGSTRSDWSRPMGSHTRLLASEDLPCGACMEPECRFDDVHCLSRHTAENIFKLASEVERR